MTIIKLIEIKEKSFWRKRKEGQDRRRDRLLSQRGIEQVAVGNEVDGKDGIFVQMGRLGGVETAKKRIGRFLRRLRHGNKRGREQFDSGTSVALIAQRGPSSHCFDQVSGHAHDS